MKKTEDSAEFQAKDVTPKVFFSVAKKSSIIKRSFYTRI